MVVYLMGLLDQCCGTWLGFSILHTFTVYLLFHAEQSASSQPTWSRRKPCAAPAAAEAAITSPQFSGQCATRHCALIITSPGPRKNGSISGRPEPTLVRPLVFRVVHFTVRSSSHSSSLPLRAAYSRRPCPPAKLGSA